MLIAKGATGDAKSSFVYDPLGGAVATNLIDVRVGTNLLNIVEVVSGVGKCMDALVEAGLDGVNLAAAYLPADNSVSLSATPFLADEDAVHVTIGSTALPIVGQSGIFKTTVDKCRDTYLENRDT